MGNTPSEIIQDIKEGKCDKIFSTLYVDAARLSTEKERYIKAINDFVDLFGNREISIFSAPGRCEIGGNHTIIHIHSDGYGRMDIDISSLEIDRSETGSTNALIRGVVAGLFNENQIDAITQAKIGQQAENKYFGKPSGLLDQMGCSVGGLTFIDFEDSKEPVVKSINSDFDAFKHSLCIVDTKASHEKLTNEYSQITQVRRVCGDRAVLRAIHIFDDNRRVDGLYEALINNDFDTFKNLIKESGESSYKYLQNIFSVNIPQEQ